ncbi:hypothetical protein P9112_006656 [Eukaryota sp. TZLM1-RC]
MSSSLGFDKSFSLDGLTKYDTNSTAAGFFDAFDENRQFRSSLHEFAYTVAVHPAFSIVLIFVILINVISVALQTSRSFAMDFKHLIAILDAIFLSIYLFEFILKYYGLGNQYWHNHYNKFDFFILLVSLFTFIQVNFTFLNFLGDLSVLRVVQALRAMRSLRAISIIPALRILFEALIKTVLSIGNLALLLILILYVFGIMGYYLYGTEGDPERYGSLGSALLTLMCYVTIDEWTEVNRVLDTHDKSSRFYILAFVLMGHILFTNLFIGVVIRNLDVAIEENRSKVEKKKKKLLSKKKLLILRKQHNELSNLAQSTKNLTETEINEMMAKLAGKLHHSDTVPVLHLCCSVPWMEAFQQLMVNYEDDLYRLQQVYFEIAQTLAEAVELKLNREMRI